MTNVVRVFMSDFRKSAPPSAGVRPDLFESADVTNFFTPSSADDWPLPVCATFSGLGFHELGHTDNV
jgi:hypothetical protein